MYSTFQLSVTDRLAVLRLDRGRSNPINHQMVQELTACVHELESNKEVGGLVLTGKEGIFSSGIDLIEAYNYNEEQSRAFWSDFINMQTVLASFKKPMGAAITGHSPAGGCVLAVCADYRVMCEGNFIIGLNEIPVGIVVPDSVFNIYAFWLGQRRAYQFLMEGKLVQPNEALEIGLIDQVAASVDVLGLTEKKIRAYMQLPASVWMKSKQNLRRELIEKLSADQTETLNAMLKQWLAPATRKGLEMMIQNLKSKSN